MYWLQWQVPVCALILVIPLAVAIRLILRSTIVPFNGSDLWMPCWRNLHPLFLLAYRFTVFLSMSWMLCRMVLVHGFFAFYFYTQWTFTLVIIYFAIATVMSAHGCWAYWKRHIENEERGPFLKANYEEDKTTNTNSRTTSSVKLERNHEQELIEKKARIWGYPMQAIYQTCAGAVMLTDIVFWCILVPFLTGENFHVTLLMGFMHSLNAAFLLLDTALNSMPFPRFRLAYFVVWSCAYVIFQWVLHACGFSWWPYPFLELATPWAPLWYLCLALVHLPCFGIYALIVYIKNLVFPKWFPSAYIKSY